MPSFLRSSSLLILALGLLSTAATARAADTTVIELRTYTALPGRLDALLARFRDHTCKLFEKHGMVNVGYWVPLDEKDGAGKKLVYLLQHGSREAAAASWKAFGADPAWVAARTASEASGRIVEKVESVFLSTTDFSPAWEAAKSGGGLRVYEMRTYYAAEGKLPALNARFRNHTLARFQQHGMTNVVYLHPLDADKGAGRTLVYFLAYPNREAATKAWAAFRADPIWTSAKSESEKDGPLTSKVESVFFAPTDFSALK
jgi:NIPSNAP